MQFLLFHVVTQYFMRLLNISCGYSNLTDNASFNRTEIGEVDCVNSAHLSMSHNQKQAQDLSSTSIYR